MAEGDSVDTSEKEKPSSGINGACDDVRRRSTDEQMDTGAQMKAFLEKGISPCLGHVRGVHCGNCRVAGVAQDRPRKGARDHSALYAVHDEFATEAKRILDTVISKYGDTQAFIEAAFGPPMAKQVRLCASSGLPPATRLSLFRRLQTPI